mmetsp:Transcript_20314/g.32798  ORF Transcript_20314/g.32798 Transcript_20314/m.32798 type:complete len:779 (+) Transcript_20314:1-2337(+)
MNLKYQEQMLLNPVKEKLLEAASEASQISETSRQPQLASPPPELPETNGTDGGGEGISETTTENGSKKPKDRAGSAGSMVSLIDEAEQIEDCISEASADYEKELGDKPNALHVAATTNIETVMGSALSHGLAFQAVAYLVALGGIMFVLIAKSTKLGDDTDTSVAVDCHGSAGGRRLAGGPSPLLSNIAYCLAGAGLITFFVNLMKQPLILGYLLGGVFIGPIGLDIVHSEKEIADVSSLGLVFLLFMIGLELDVSELAKMGRVVVVTGMLQFPLCAGIHFGIFTLFANVFDLSFGDGEYSTFYVGMTCAISSTMIVVKLLSDMADMDSAPGRLTIGILIFQDIWAIIVLAIQPDLDKPNITTLLETFGKIAGLIVIALAYAKFVMPAVFFASSKNVELMLVLSLCWCFCMCSLAILPFVGLSMELAALISGVALATFPYSAEFNGKIKYIRDFFITLFFCGLGMQIPSPTFAPIAKAFLIAIVVLLVRWIGIFSLVLTLGGGRRLAAVATINLSEISEFALVICTLGKDFGHVEGDTLTILIWVFALLAIFSANMLPFNYQIYGLMHRLANRILKRPEQDKDKAQLAHDTHVDRNIVLLGFHKIAAMLVADFEHHSPSLLAKLHVIDFHEDLELQLRRRGVTFAYGDISSPDVLEHAAHGDVRLVLCTIPDSLLRGTSNLRLLAASKQAWPNADVIVTCDNPHDAQLLYDAGADYVLRMAKLCAERLHEIVNEHATHHVHHHHAGTEMSLNHVFQDYKLQDHQTEKSGVIKVGQTKV